MYERQRAITSRVKSSSPSQSLCDKGDSKGGIDASPSPFGAVIDKSVASVSTKSNTGLSAVRVGQK